MDNINYEEITDQDIQDTIERLVNKDKIKVFQVTDGIQMKLIEAADKEDHFKVIMKNKQYLLNTMDWAQYYNTIEDSIAFINSMEQYHEETTKLCYLIWQNQKVIGSIAFQILDLGLLQGEIGYWLDEDECGKGIMAKCLRILIDHGFNYYELRKAIIKCMISNGKSANVAIRQGFREIGIEKDAIQLKGISYDFRVFWLTRDQYFNSNQK